VRRFELLLAMTIASLPAGLRAETATFRHPLDVPAVPSAMAATSPLYAAATAGARVVAVGRRGHIVFSDDGGATWTQARVPVSTDLVAVSFPTKTHGWAVGHGGVVLRSTDAGSTWVKQLDGRRTAELVVAHLKKAIGDGAPDAEQLLAREQRLIADGGNQPLLGVYFATEKTGYIVGSFNRILRTDDGGESWTPWVERTDNPDELHFNAIAGNEHGLYVAGERGMVWAYDPKGGRFVARPTPYEGSLFGLAVDGAGTVLAYGMRGSLYRSADAGRSWEKVPLATTVGITGGQIESGGSALLVTQGGTILRSDDGGRSFAPLGVDRPMAYFGISQVSPGRIAVVGSEGVRLESVGNQPASSRQ